jgi:diacylglycerol kinase (ATP)
LGRAFYFAWQGLRYAWRSERNFRLGVFIGLGALALGAYLGVDLAPILLCCVAVLTIELLNTAFEATIDLLAPGVHPLAKTAKDVAAAAVLLACLGAALVGLLLLGPPLWQRLVG